MGLLEGFPELANLDNKKWDELVEEARLLLARYSKDWTDHNIHDPGITLIELFAWLAEMQIYQLNRVTDANYTKFLKLVGIYPADIEPARVDVTFGDATNEIKEGESLVVEFGGEKIYYETEEKLIPTSAEIKKIITVTDSQIVDNTSANEKEGVYFAPFGEKASSGAMFKLGFDKPLDETEVKITFVLFEKDLPAPGSHADEIAQVIPSAKVTWEYYSRKGWKELPIQKDATLAFHRSGRIAFNGRLDMSDDGGFYWIRCNLKEGSYEIIPLIDKICLNTISAVQIERINNESLGTGNGKPEYTVKLKNNPAIRDALFRVEDVLDWIAFLKQLKDQDKKKEPNPGKRILSRFDPKTLTLINEWKGDKKPYKEPDDFLKYAIVKSLNKVVEGRNLYDFESFKDINLANVPKKILNKNLDIIPIEELKILNRFLIEAAHPDEFVKNRLVIRTIKENDEWEYWYLVDDFESSGPDDVHCIFDPEKDEITFGNGLNGRIPEENENIKASYIITLGSKGNIPPGQKFNSVSTGNIQGNNLKDATGGKEAESVEHAKARAKKDCREIYRAITSNDYEYLARSTPGLRIYRAKAIPNYNPDYPRVVFPGAVSVVVVPYTRQGTDPTPREEFVRMVSNHLNKHRLVTADIHVIRPEYITISVKCKVHALKKSSPVMVEERIKKALEDFLNPIKGGPEGNGWPFGRSVYPSEIYQKIDNVDGVDYVTDVSISSYSKPYQKDAIRIPAFGLVYSGEHQIEYI
ncbi:MAG TPA: putative baseplate assembly protein [Candidatus Methanoperedens sp.]